MKKVQIAILVCTVLALIAGCGGQARAEGMQIDVLLNGVRNTNNAMLAGGKVYTYQVGTTTAKTTYTNRALTTPAANPIVLDSYGRAQVYTDAPLKMVVKTSADVTVYTWDNVVYNYNVFTDLSTISTTAVTGKIDYLVDVRAYGAIPDDGVDDTDEIQAALDSTVSGTRYGAIIIPEGTWLCNITLRNKCSIYGVGMSTILEPFTDAPVFSVPASTSVTDIKIADLMIDGTTNKATFTSSDGINLTPTGTGKWVDGVRIDNVNIEDMGRYGIVMKGTATAGPFVQSYNISNTNITGCSDSGLNIWGLVLEGMVENCKIYANGSSTLPNAIVQVDTVSSTNPFRQTFKACVINGTAADPLVVTALDLKGSCQTLIEGCDFEQGNPAIYIRNAVSQNVELRCNRFTASYAVGNFIKVDNCNGLLIENNRFVAPATATTPDVTAAIRFTGLPSVLKYPVTTGNVFGGSGTYTDAVLYDTSYDTIASGALNMYRNYIAVAGQGGLADDLDNLYDEAGGITLLEHGRRVIIRCYDAADAITVTSAGNIAVAASRVLNTTTSSLELIWDDTLSKWLE